MPWTEDDARAKNHHIKTDKQARQWVHVANRVLEETGDEGRAIREANGVVHPHLGGVHAATND
jgi:hypothetical protein